VTSPPAQPGIRLNGPATRALAVSDAPEFFNFATDVFDAWARQQPDALALWCVDAVTGSENKLSFRDLSALSQRAAGFFRQAGVQPGDHVLVMLPRIAPWWIATLGLIRMGAVPVPATLLLTPREVGYRLETGQIRAVVTNAQGAAKVEGFQGIRFLVDDGPSGWTDFLKGVAATGQYRGLRTRADAPGMLFFTSATTGDPKMVLHTQASYGLAHQATGRLWLDCRPGEVHWNISDLGWAKAAWSSFFGPWHAGACIFALDIPGRFDASLTLDILQRYPIATWCVPPTALRLIVRQELGHRSFPSLRRCFTAGEPLNPEVFKLWKQATGLDLHEGYGQTETVVLAGSFSCPATEIRPGAIGKPTPGMDLVLIDEAMKEVPPGTEGEIALRVRPSRPLGLFQEYWMHPDETARQFQGVFYLTGDRAVSDTDGYLWFVGRKDDVIKSSGYRIGPFEIESALLEHPAVMDVAVVGKADEVRGQIVKAFVILRPGHTGSAALQSQLQQHCRKTVAPFKCPREIEFVDELPKTTSGKTRRVELRAKRTAP
jgi:acyl-coenzyme A synthetase/AMP-(fatty) acid ligase